MRLSLKHSYYPATVIVGALLLAVGTHAGDSTSLTLSGIIRSSIKTQIVSERGSLLRSSLLSLSRTESDPLMPESETNSTEAGTLEIATISQRTNDEDGFRVYLSSSHGGSLTPDTPEESQQGVPYELQFNARSVAISKKPALVFQSPQNSGVRTHRHTLRMKMSPDARNVLRQSKDRSQLSDTLTLSIVSL